MLTACAMCEQVIEISTYNEHLLAECEHKVLASALLVPLFA